MHKRLENVPERAIISNCRNDFKCKIRNIDIPNDALLVTADVVGLYPNIPHEVALSALREVLYKRTRKEIPTENLIKMADFVLKNNFFEFDTNVYQQISGTVIGTKFALPYAGIFMDQLETKFLENQNLKPLVWSHYTDDIFFIWTHGEENL